MNPIIIDSHDRDVSRALAATFDIHLEPGWHARALAEEVRRGLAERPRRLSPRWLYDDRGSELFDQITRLPEYYPTESERALMADCAAEIATLTRADTFVELGSGTSDKTRTLLDALDASGRLRRFVPFDVSEQTLRGAAHQLNARYPRLAIHGVVGDFHAHLDWVPNDDVAVLGFLGSTIGNLYPDERKRFLDDVVRWMNDDSFFLLGIDLVKLLDRIVDAYNDAAGVTAAFTLNVLHVLNRELGANFDPDAFEHVAMWDPTHTRADLRLRSRRDQSVDVPGAGLHVEFRRDEELQVEISSKFTVEQISDELRRAGMELVRRWRNRDTALLLARAVADAPGLS